MWHAVFLHVIEVVLRILKAGSYYFLPRYITTCIFRRRTGTLEADRLPIIPEVYDVGLKYRLRVFDLSFRFCSVVESHGLKVCFKVKYAAGIDGKKKAANKAASIGVGIYIVL